MSLFLLGLLGAALPAGGSGDEDDEDKSEDDGSEDDARAPSAEDAEGESEGASLLDYAMAEAATDPAAAPAAEEDDPWALEAEDAAYEDAQAYPDDDDEPAAAAPEAASTEAEAVADLDVLAAIARLTAIPSSAETDDWDDADWDEEGDDTAHLAAMPEPAEIAGDDAAAADRASAWDDEDDDWDDEDDEDLAEEAPEDQFVTTIADYQPGVDQIEISIFAQPPGSAVDVMLQQTADGSGTEVLIEGKLRAILDGVMPGDVDANDLYIEFAG